jgi:hypothetical protein
MVPLWFKLAAQVAIHVMVGASLVEPGSVALDAQSQTSRSAAPGERGGVAPASELLSSFFEFEGARVGVDRRVGTSCSALSADKNLRGTLHSVSASLGALWHAPSAATG